MSLFDTPKNKSVAEDYPDEKAFLLIAAHYDGIQDTQYGKRPQATLVISDAEDGAEPVEYKVWGTLAEQVSEMDETLPIVACVGPEGKRTVFRQPK